MLTVAEDWLNPNLTVKDVLWSGVVGKRETSGGNH